MTPGKNLERQDPKTFRKWSNSLVFLLESHLSLFSRVFFPHILCTFQGENPQKNKHLRKMVTRSHATRNSQLPSDALWVMNAISTRCVCSSNQGCAVTCWLHHWPGRKTWRDPDRPRDLATIIPSSSSLKRTQHQGIPGDTVVIFVGLVMENSSSYLLRMLNNLWFTYRHVYACTCISSS